MGDGEDNALQSSRGVEGAKGIGLWTFMGHILTPFLPQVLNNYSFLCFRSRCGCVITGVPVCPEAKSGVCT